MKKIFIFFVFVIQYLNGYGQVASDCNIAPELREAYNWDVGKMALTRIIQTHSVYADSIAIPESVKDTIWAGLAAIFNAYSIPERDSVFDVYCIHMYDCWLPPRQMVGVSLDTTFDWTRHWINNEMETGYKELDDFLSEYDFHLMSQYGLETFSYLNLKAFVDSLKKFDGIIHANEWGLNCCDNEIAYEKNSNTQVFNFEMNFIYGEHFCPNQYAWKFEIDNACKVKLTQSKHYISDHTQTLSPVDFKNCHITSGIQRTISGNSSQFSIRPNPIDDEVVISTGLQGVFYIVIHDIQGRIIYSDAFIGQLNLSLNDYNSGLYLINIYSGNYKISNSYKIIKK